SPGYTDEIIEIYVAEGLDFTERAPQGAEEHGATFYALPIAQALARISRGELTDAKTLIALLEWNRRRAGSSGYPGSSRRRSCGWRSRRSGSGSWWTGVTPSSSRRKPAWDPASPTPNTRLKAPGSCPPPKTSSPKRTWSSK